MIKETIYEYWDKELPEVFPREVETDSSDLINDVVGIRRCGKTFMMFSKIRELLKKVNKKSTIYINFENRKLFPLNTNYFNEIIEFIHFENLLDEGKVYLFLDEVQKIDGWEKYIRSIYDEFKGKIKIFVSGSNASLLSRDYGTLLTGRHLSKTLMPLSFKEFLRFKKYEVGKVLTEKHRANIKKFLEEYLNFGGFPEVVLSENKEQMLSQLFNDILTKDILSRNIRKESTIEEFSYYLAGNVSSLLSFNKMANYFKSRGIKISVPTIENYFKLKKKSFDNYLINIFYWKNIQHEEVDFVIKEGIKVIQLIQACYSIENVEIKKREIKALIKASNELKCNDLFIITKSYENEEKIDNKKIKFIPLWKWLLE